MTELPDFVQQELDFARHAKLFFRVCCAGIAVCASAYSLGTTASEAVLLGILFVTSLSAGIGVRTVTLIGQIVVIVCVLTLTHIIPHPKQLYAFAERLVASQPATAVPQKNWARAGE
jgi:hypothetical protein